MRTICNKFRRIADKERRDRFVDKEDGSLTIFTLFMFILIVMITGMAVDLMRYESERVSIQNTIDTAVVATSSLTQSAGNEAEVRSLVKEHFAKAGYDPDMVNVSALFEETGGTATGRSVTASVDFQMDTMFMNIMGIEHLKGYTGGAAREGQQLIEIALVLDVSGSMGSNSKLENLKIAAKDFVTTVINASGSDRVSISIVPYNQQVYVDDNLAARINWTNTQMTVASGGPSYTGAITDYTTLDPTARCARFRDADYATRSLASGGSVEASAMYSKNNIGMNAPTGNQYWCGENFPRIMLYQNNETTLHTHIDSLSANGWTAIDYGMNWAVGILDPSFAPIVSDMVTNNLLPAQMEGHPVAYSNVDVLKYVVLMTDGINTVHEDLKPQYNSGPSPVWYSASAAAAGNEDNGFFVEMPNNAATSQFFVPNQPGNTSDDAYVHQNVLPADAIQWDYHAVYNRFSVNAAANYFFGGSNDAAAYAAHQNVVEDSGGYSTADTRVNSICNTAKANEQIEIFTVAFEAPTDAQTLLANCASKPGNYFDVDGTQISAAFSSIASEISKLRLTQ